MITFTYEAYNRNGVIVRGVYEAQERGNVVTYLTKHSLTPILIEKLHKGRLNGNLFDFRLFEHLTSVDVMFFVRNLATTIKAGLSIVESLDILIADAEKKILKKVLQDAQAMIKNGRLLSEGFQDYSESFPPIFMGMLKAGEISGQLDKTLAELAKYLSKEYELRSKIKSALTYPVILLIASTGVIVLLLVFVLPRLTKAFLQSGVELPFLTKIFIGLSNLLTYSFTIDTIILFIIAWFFLYFRKTHTGKKFFFYLISHLPVANALVKKIAIVRFARTFSNLIGSGLGVIESLELSAQSIGNPNYSIAIREAILDIKNGVSMSNAFSKHPELFPRLLISLIVVGERTGSLQDVLLTFSNFYEEEVDNNLKDLTSLLEPVLLLIMGLMVGAIAISIILPIYQLVGHFV